MTGDHLDNPVVIDLGHFQTTVFPGDLDAEQSHVAQAVNHFGRNFLSFIDQIGIDLLGKEFCQRLQNGITGSTIGLLVFYRLCLGAPANNTFNPISPVGMLAAAAGAFGVLIAYRILVACVMIDHPQKEAKEAAKE